MRLLVDAMLGRLVAYLRMAGHDTVYAPDAGVEADGAVVDLADREGRRVLTRDRAIAAMAPSAVLLTSLDIEDQLREVRAAGIDLELDGASRCGRCNGRLEPVPPGSALPPAVPDPGSEPVWRCRDCGQCFWRGSHWTDVRDRLAGL